MISVENKNVRQELTDNQFSFDKLTEELIHEIDEVKNLKSTKETKLKQKPTLGKKLNTSVENRKEKIAETLSSVVGTPCEDHSKHFPTKHRVKTSDDDEPDKSKVTHCLGEIQRAEEEHQSTKQFSMDHARKAWNMTSDTTDSSESEESDPKYSEAFESSDDSVSHEQSSVNRTKNNALPDHNVDKRTPDEELEISINESKNNTTNNAGFVPPKSSVITLDGSDKSKTKSSSSASSTGSSTSISSSSTTTSDTSRDIKAKKKTQKKSMPGHDTRKQSGWGFGDTTVKTAKKDVKPGLANETKRKSTSDTRSGTKKTDLDHETKRESTNDTRSGVEGHRSAMDAKSEETADTKMQDSSLSNDYGNEPRGNIQRKERTDSLMPMFGSYESTKVGTKSQSASEVSMTESDQELKQINNMYYEVKWDLIYYKKVGDKLSNPLTRWKKVTEVNLPKNLKRPREKFNYVKDKIELLTADKKALKRQKFMLEKKKGLHKEKQEKLPVPFTEIVRKFFSREQSSTDASMSSQSGDLLPDEEMKIMKERVQDRRRRFTVHSAGSGEIVQLHDHDKSIEDLRKHEEDEKELIMKYSDARKALKMFTAARWKLRRNMFDLGVPFPDDVVTDEDKLEVINTAITKANEDIKEVKQKRDVLRKEKQETTKKIIERQQWSEACETVSKTTGHKFEELSKVKTDKDEIQDAEKSTESKAEEDEADDKDKDETASKVSQESAPPANCLDMTENALSNFYVKHIKGEDGRPPWAVSQGQKLMDKIRKKHSGEADKEGEKEGDNGSEKSASSTCGCLGMKKCKKHTEKGSEDTDTKCIFIKHGQKVIREFCQKNGCTHVPELDEKPETKEVETATSVTSAKDTTEDKKSKKKKKKKSSSKSGSSKSGSSESGSSSASESTSGETESISSGETESTISSKTENEKKKGSLKSIGFSLDKHRKMSTSSEDWPSHAKVRKKLSDDNSLYASISEATQEELQQDSQTLKSTSTEEWPSHTNIKAVNAKPWDSKEQVALSSSTGYTSAASGDSLARIIRRKRRSTDKESRRKLPQLKRSERLLKGPGKIRMAAVGRHQVELGQLEWNVPSAYYPHIGLERNTTGRISPWSRRRSVKQYPSSRYIPASSLELKRPSLSGARQRRLYTCTKSTKSSSDYFHTSRHILDSEEEDFGLSKLQMSEIAAVIQQTILEHRKVTTHSKDIGSEDQLAKSFKKFNALMERVKKLEVQDIRNRSQLKVTRTKLDVTKKQLSRAEDEVNNLKNELSQAAGNSQAAVQELSKIMAQLQDISDLKNRIKVLEIRDSKKEIKLSDTKCQLKHAEIIMRSLWQEVNNTTRKYRQDILEIQANKAKTALGIANSLASIQSQMHSMNKNTAGLKEGLHHMVNRKLVPVAQHIHALNHEVMDTQQWMLDTLADYEELIPLKELVDDIKLANMLPENPCGSRPLMSCDNLAEFHKYKLLLEELTEKVLPRPFDFEDRKATLYEKRLFEAYDKELASDVLPKPGEYLEERITGCKEGHEELEELLQLNSLHQICVLLKYVGDECLRVLNKELCQRSGYNYAASGNLSVPRKFVASSWELPVDDVTLAIFLAKLMVEMDQLVDELEVQNDIAHPPAPKWFDKTQEVTLGNNWMKPTNTVHPSANRHRPGMDDFIPESR